MIILHAWVANDKIVQVTAILSKCKVETKVRLRYGEQLKVASG